MQPHTFPGTGHSCTQSVVVVWGCSFLGALFISHVFVRSGSCEICSRLADKPDLAIDASGCRVKLIHLQDGHLHLVW